LRFRQSIQIAAHNFYVTILGLGSVPKSAPGLLARLTWQCVFGRAHTACNPVTTPIERMSVLVADADQWTRASVSAVLGEAGFTVCEVSNGMSALRSAQATPPRVAFVGTRLSEVGTAEVLRSLRADARTRHTALILIGQADVALHADARIELPCSDLEVLASVMQALSPRSPDAPRRAHRGVLPARTPRGAASQADAAAPMRSVLASIC
jgi:CheY-like chemotaxis protein